MFKTTYYVLASSPRPAKSWDLGIQTSPNYVFVAFIVKRNDSVDITKFGDNAGVLDQEK